MEFEEMWGGSGAQYNLSNIKFGPKKTNDTPHEFVIGGKRVENYFSPSDNVNAQIERTIKTANSSLQFATFVFTRSDLAYAIQDRVWNNVDANGMVDDSSSGGGFAFSIMESVMNNKIILYDHNNLQGILHHKYLIVDQDNPASDALVLTGSHNWSTTANTKNDENTLVVHDPLIANQYYQEFVKRFNESGGGLYFDENSETSFISIYPNPVTESLYFNWKETSMSNVTITIYDDMGKAIIFEKNIQSAFLKIDISNLTKGLYQMVLQNNAKRICAKFVKQ
jgi:phosphatidylserine/phosphatidylglycerophosphate/cardiolipin synthase-like enzyme